MSKLGGWFFRRRGLIPVPLFLVLFFLSVQKCENNLLMWSLGPFFLILGAALRGWGVRHIGKANRTLKRKCKRIIASGPYSLTRNPLYLGNLFILVSFTVMSGLLWLLPIFVPFFFFYYTCIILWEEDILRESFSEEAENYFKRVPRWWSMKGIRGRIEKAFSFEGSVPLREIIYREKRTWQFLAVMTVLLLLKDILDSDYHSIFIPFLH